MINLNDAIERLADAKRSAKIAAQALTAQGESDEAAMKALAAMDALDVAINEIKLRIRAIGGLNGKIPLHPWHGLSPRVAAAGDPDRAWKS